jgi:hypothetical protein
VEITKIVISTTPTTCGGGLIFAEGLKSFFGPSCTISALVYGTVVLKPANCGTSGEPATGSTTADLQAEFGASATYRCENGFLSVENVTGPGNASLPNVPLSLSGSGVGSFTTASQLGVTGTGLCAGGLGATSATVFSTASGTLVTAIGSTTVAGTFCPTGPGVASLQACLAPPLLNTQPSVCSNTISATFTANQSRVVPYVRWAGEKIDQMLRRRSFRYASGVCTEGERPGSRRHAHPSRAVWTSVDLYVHQ